MPKKKNENTEGGLTGLTAYKVGDVMLIDVKEWKRLMAYLRKSGYSVKQKVVIKEDKDEQETG